MALVDTTWYCNFGNGTSTGYYAVTVRPQNTAVAAGVLRRQFTAPAVGSERVFVCIVAGTTANTTDATWVLTRGAKTTDGTATWMECTGQASLNGDLTNTATWAQVKAATPAVLGQIIKRSNGASYQICTTAGAMSASEPAFSDTAGVTTTDTTAVWTSLGVVGSFTAGQAPHARLANALTLTWFSAGSTIYVADNHAETQATSITLTMAGNSSGAIGKVLCHNHSGSYPPASGDLTTGATVSTTGTNIITVTGPGGYYYGIAFRGGSGSSGSGAFLIFTSSSPANQTWTFFDNCSFRTVVTAASCYMSFTTGVFVLNNCTVSFGNVVHYMNITTMFTWQNTGQILFSGSSVPNTLFDSAAWSAPMIVLQALDLSQLTGNLFNNTNTITPQVGSLLIKDCKLNASAANVNPLHTGHSVQLARCSSSAVAYTSSRYAYEGTETTETTITRVGGAVDPTGQAQTRKIVTTANAQWLRPFEAEPYAIWNTVTGTTVTVTVYGTINAGAVPNNDDIWLEVEYLGSSASPIGTIVTTTKASLLATNAAVSSDSSSWNGGGSGAGWSPFKLVATLSSPQPGMAGYIDVRVRAAKASTTYYIDPKIELT
jgi:hypothetical protein